MNIGIEKKIEEYKVCKDKILLEEIIKYYEPFFCKRIKEVYGNKYIDKAKKELPLLVNYYFEKNIHDKLCNYLSKKSKTIFNTKENFDDKINNGNEELIKKHYISKFYNKLISGAYSSVLTDKQKLNLSVLIVNNVYDNYVKSSKSSGVALSFNSMLNNKLELFKNEQTVLLYYVRKIELTNNIKKYFYKKYKYLIKDYKYVTYDDFKLIVDEVLKRKYTSNAKLDDRIKRLIKEKEALNESKIPLEKRYAYIKDLVFNKLKSKVSVSEDVLKCEIDKKYNDYILVVKEKLRNGDSFNIKSYLNNRLTDHIKRRKSFFKYVYVDKDLVEKTRKDNVYLVEKYAVRYAKSVDQNTLSNNLSKKYDELVQEYYKKMRKTPFLVYVQNGLRSEANMLRNNYVDDEIKEKTKKPKLK